MVDVVDLGCGCGLGGGVEVVEGGGACRFRSGSRCRRGGARGLGGVQARQERAELQLLIYIAQLVEVGLGAQQVGGALRDGYVGLDGDQEFREGDLLGVGLDLLLQRAFERGDVLKQVLDRAPLVDELGGRLLADSRASRHIVGDVALEGQQVDDLRGRGDAVAVAHLLGAAHLEALALERRPVHEHAVGDQLAVVLVGRHHICGEALLGGDDGEGADDVVGLVVLHLDHADAVGADDAFDVWDGEGDVLGLLVALCLVLGVGLVAEGFAVGRVEADGHVGGILLAEDLLERVAEAENGRGVAAVGGDPRRAYQRVVGAVNQRVCVQQKQFLLFHVSGGAVFYDSKITTFTLYTKINGPL